MTDFRTHEDSSAVDDEAPLPPQGRQPLRMLTIWQPWASLVIAGAKPFEFRSHPAPSTIVDQRIVIHAGKTRVPEHELRDLIKILNHGLTNGEGGPETCLFAERAMPVIEAALRDELPRGCGLGTAIVGESRNGYDVAELFGAEHVNDSDRNEHANYGWPLREIRAWPEPIPARGGQGIKFWPPEIETPLGRSIFYPEDTRIPIAGPR